MSRRGQIEWSLRVRKAGLRGNPFLLGARGEQAVVVSACWQSASLGRRVYRCTTRQRALVIGRFASLFPLRHVEAERAMCRVDARDLLLGSSRDGAMIGGFCAASCSHSQVALLNGSRGQMRVYQRA